VEVKCLLDTNAYTALRRGHDEVVAIVRSSEEVLISAIVAGELLFGFRNGTRFAVNRRDLEAFLGAPRVRLLSVNLTTADRYGTIAMNLRRKGRPLPQNDIWIAAHALEHGADLVSFDGHFSEVDGLSWVQPEAEA
jgi:tRNA(fMet)-specific endonuclease VapC